MSSPSGFKIAEYIRHTQSQKRNRQEGFVLIITKTKEYPQNADEALKSTTVGYVFFRGGLWRADFRDENLDKFADIVGGLGLRGDQDYIPWH